jgi:hypothetical protein
MPTDIYYPTDKIKNLITAWNAMIWQIADTMADGTDAELQFMAFDMVEKRLYELLKDHNLSETIIAVRDEYLGMELC